MSRWIPALVLAGLASIPLWVTNLYVLHIVITAGIFIVAAMSLNLLLGYAGQLSLGHVAFFGIGAYASALVSLGFDIHLTDDFSLGLGPQPVWLAMFTGLLVAGLHQHGQQIAVIPALAPSLPNEGQDDAVQGPPHLPPAPVFDCNGSSAIYGTGGLAEFESTIVLSIGPSTCSIVSRYMRSRVTPGAFLYCS